MVKTIVAKTNVDMPAPRSGKMQKPANMSCVLAALSEPRLGGVLPGLVPVAGGFELAEGAFACCQGSGLRPCQGGGQINCALKTRMRALARLAAAYERACCRGEGLPSWPGPAFDPDPQFFTFALQKLALLKTGASGKGVMYTLPAAAPQRFSLWTVAFAATWRFGFDVRMVGILDYDVAKALTTQGPLGEQQAPTLILIEAANRLWDARCADAFEAAVGLAYRARFPLWISWSGEPQEPKAAASASARPVSRALAERLRRIKQRSPLAWLETSTRSKLLELCDTAGARSRGH